MKLQLLMLTALGLWPDGHGEILAWPLASQEDAVSWGTFVGTLYTKGVTEHTTALIGSDGSQGLEKALDLHLYGVPHQRCIFHFIPALPGALPSRASTPARPPCRPPAARRMAAVWPCGPA